MSDLRTRIVAVIEAQHVSEFQGGIHPEDVIRLADAVIRELDLGIPCATDGCRMRKIAIRSAEKLGITEVDDSG
jgi:hypothetical protein